ncbi:MAG: hypothetical protein ACXWLH_02735 [Candidatus Saccharimonadales bacterium]
MERSTTHSYRGGVITATVSYSGPLESNDEYPYGLDDAFRSVNKGVSRVAIPSLNQLERGHNDGAFVDVDSELTTTHVVTSEHKFGDHTCTLTVTAQTHAALPTKLVRDVILESCNAGFAKDTVETTTRYATQDSVKRVLSSQISSFEDLLGLGGRRGVNIGDLFTGAGGRGGFGDERGGFGYV